MNKDIRILNQVLESLQDDKLNSNQIDKLLLILSRSLSEKAPTKRLQHRLNEQTELLLTEVKKNEKQGAQNALRELREGFYIHGPKILSNTLKNAKKVKDSDIEFRPSDRALKNWLEDIMGITKPGYKINKIDNEDISDLDNKKYIDNEYEMNNPYLVPSLLKSIAQKGYLTSFDISDIQTEFNNGGNLTSLIKAKVTNPKRQNIIRTMVDEINDRYNSIQERRKDLY